MIEEHFLPTTILRNMSKQKIFDDLLLNMKRRVNQKRISSQTDSNFIQILEEKVEMVDKMNNELNGINSNNEEKRYKKEKTKWKKKNKINTHLEITGSKEKTANDSRDTLILPDIINRRENMERKTRGNANNTLHKLSHNKKKSESNKNNMTRKNTLLGENSGGVNVNLNTINEAYEDRASSKRYSMRIHKENLFFDSKKDTINSNNFTNSKDIVPHENSNNNSNNNINNPPLPIVPLKPNYKSSVYESTIDHTSSRSLAINNVHLNSISPNQNLIKSSQKSSNNSIHSLTRTQIAFDNKAINNSEQPIQKLLAAPSKFSSSHNLKNHEMKKIIVNFENEDRRQEILLTKNNDVQLFLKLFREKLEKNNKKRGSIQVNIKPATLKPGSKLTKIYNKCFKEFKFSLEIDKVLNNEKNRSISGESKEFENFMKFFKKEENYFIEEILRMKEKNQNRKVFLYNKTKDPSNIDISKISDNLAFVNRKFFIERYGYNYNEEADFIFQDLLNDDKGVSKNHIRAEEKRNKKHEKIENYLDNTIKKKKELISHLSKKLSVIGKEEKKKLASV